MAVNYASLLYGTHKSQSFRLTSVPRSKFQYTIGLRIHNWPEISAAMSTAGIRNSAITDERDFDFTAQTVELPSHSYDTMTLDAYNKKRVVTIGISYNPITLTFHDTVDNKLETLIRAYNLYYFGNFEKSQDVYALDTVPTNEGSAVSTDYGYKVPITTGDPGAKYFFERVNIFREFGDGAPHGPVDSETLLDPSKTAGLVRDEISVINPMISNVTHDTLSYGDSSPATWSITFTYEAIEYGDTFRQTKDSGLFDSFS